MRRVAFHAASLSSTHTREEKTEEQMRLHMTDGIRPAPMDVALSARVQTKDACIGGKSAHAQMLRVRRGGAITGLRQWRW